jgi:hypothetical protein
MSAARPSKTRPSPNSHAWSGEYAPPCAGPAAVPTRVAITTPLETEPWGERYFQVTDPNGVVVQFVQWMETG